jgi:outer membrane protein with beta-barrel domain
MSDHEFEKQVQRKMDELKLRPSGAVWTAVEQNIRQHKRRRFAFWWPLAFVFLAATGYVVYDLQQDDTTQLAKSRSIKVGNNEPVASNEKTIVSDNTSTLSDKNNSVNNGPVTATTDNISNASAQSPAHSQQQHPGKQLVNPVAGAHETFSNDVESRLPDAAIRRNTNATDPITTELNTTEPVATEPITNEPVTTNSFDFNTPTTNKTNFNKDLAYSDPNAELNKFGSINTNAIALAPFPKESAAKPPIEKQHGPKWQFGITGSAGISRLTQSRLFDLSGWLGSGAKSQENAVAEDLSRKSSLMNDPRGASGNSLTTPPPAKKAAPIKQGLSWSAGVFAQRPLSKRLRLTVGLQYTYMSVETTIGKLVNAPVTVNQSGNYTPVVSGYYTSLDALQNGNAFNSNYQQFNPSAIPRDSLKGSDYTYRFHSIEIPVMINWQINKGRQLPPFVLDAGFSVGKLLTTDALHYDGKQDIYYKDNSLFNKTQVNALMALNIGLFQQSKTPIWVGPNLRYSLTGLLKKEVSNGQFLWSSGIQVRMMLRR